MSATNPPVVRHPNVDRSVWCEKHLHALPCAECAEDRRALERDLREWEANEYDLPVNERFAR